jgi:putative nucleotidyltransferase with HDIG domain
MLAKIDLGTIQKSIRDSTPVTFRLTSFTNDHHAMMDRVIEVFLTELGQERFLEPLAYCVKELIGNAQKANIKRMYFHERDLSITNENDYRLGMELFHQSLMKEAPRYIQKLKEEKLEVVVTFQVSGSTLYINVRNNSQMMPHEQARIYERIVRARAFSSFYEALNNAIDTTEGAGLGVLILLQTLKRFGLDEDAFSIESNNGSTIAKLIIPMSKVHFEKINLLAQVVARDIDSLPNFPENVAAILNMTNDPEVQISEIAKKISVDPVLTADLLRLVNSAYYHLSRRISNIPQAITLVGMKGVRNLLYSNSTRKILGDRYKENRSLWSHLHQTALYALYLARAIKLSREQHDDAYVAGLLHDIGLIIISNPHPDLAEKIRTFCNEKHVPRRVMENFSYGLNHADVGSLIAQKWNFPDQLVEGIKYHHEPLKASLPHKNIVFCVYLANAICNIERGNISFEQIEPIVLHELAIKGEAQFRKVHRSLRYSYDKQKTKL